ncbi:MAG: MFS transporter [Rubrobacter sp.]|nr:MFS transporter [Rubrobacter sp.]
MIVRMSLVGGMNLRPVVIAVSVATAGVLPAFLTGGLAVQIKDELGFGTAYLGLAVAIFFASAALASVVMGRFVERVGSHTGMRLAAATSAASLLGVALFARSWTALVLCLVVGGLANAMAHPSANLSIAREVPSGRQALSFGIKQASIPTATLLAGLAVPAVAATLGWRWAFVGGAILALGISLSVRGEDHVPPPKTKGERNGDARYRALAVLALGIGLGSTAATPLGAFIVGSSVESGIRVETAGLLLAAGSAFSIVVRIVFGYLADSMSGGRLRLVAGMLAVGVLGFSLLATGSPGAIVAGTLLAFGAGWGWPGLFNFAVVHSSPAAPAAATGITQTGASSGAALGPLIFGFVVEATSYGVAWMVCGGISLAALAAILVGRRMLLRDRAAMAG